MEGRLKRLFLRKKEPESDQAIDSRPVDDSTRFQASAYESTSPARRPETGEFPLHGNRKIRGTDQQQDWLQAVNSPKGHRPSRSEVTPSARAAALAAARPKSHPNGNDPFFAANSLASRTYGSNPDLAAVPEDRGREYIRLSNELSNLRLDNGNASGQPIFQPHPAIRPYGEAFTTYGDSDTAAPTSTTLSSADQRKPQRQNAKAIRQRSPPKNFSVPRYNEDIAERNLAAEPNGTPKSALKANDDRNVASIPPTRTPRKIHKDHQVGRKQSIPRKNVGGESPVQSSFATAPLPENNRRQAKIPSKPLPPTPGTEKSAINGDLPQSGSDRALNAEFIHPRKGAHERKGIRHVNEKPSLAGIVDLGTSVDTEVVERIAPAVTHETVTKEILNVREEVITREIHHHDIYHRIQPVIDVEVLPTRHYVLDKAGGLVEVFGDEVPGRQGNWVIAETVSKKASDESSSNGPLRFSARQFPDNEGDAKEYTRPDGVRVTEETWVHPPTLETGARDTGQTTPMVFDLPSRGPPDLDHLGKNSIDQQGSAIQGNAARVGAIES